MEQNPLNGDEEELVVVGEADPDKTLPPSPREEGTDAAHPNLQEVNETFREKLGGKVLLNKKDGRAVEFVEVVWEDGRAVVKLRQLGGSATETVDESEIAWDPKTGAFSSDSWNVIEVVSEDKKQAA